jgi:hypothetical protein
MVAALSFKISLGFPSLAKHRTSLGIAFNLSKKSSAAEV